MWTTACRTLWASVFETTSRQRYYIISEMIWPHQQDPRVTLRWASDHDHLKHLSNRHCFDAAEILRWWRVICHVMSCRGVITDRTTVDLFINIMMWHQVAGGHRIWCAESHERPVWLCHGDHQIFYWKIDDGRWRHQGGGHDRTDIT